MENLKVVYDLRTKIFDLVDAFEKETGLVIGSIGTNHSAITDVNLLRIDLFIETKRHW